MHKFKSKINTFKIANRLKFYSNISVKQCNSRLFFVNLDAFFLDKEILLEDSMVLGRAELKLNHPSISRQHAKIEFSADRPSIICFQILLKKGQKLPLVANTELFFWKFG